MKGILWRIVERYVAKRFAWVDDLTDEEMSSWFDGVPLMEELRA